MTRKQDTAKQPNWKEQLAGQRTSSGRWCERRVQQILEAEMDEALGAEKGERTASRQGYRSGYYNRTLVTRVGKLELRVPQDRQGRFRTEIFERYQRSEKALVSALSEMYVQGVSTRKVKAITEELCGHEFSASTVSRLNQRLDEGVGALRQAAVAGGVPSYVILEHCALREGARGRRDRASQAVMIAIGVDLGGAAQRAGR